MLTTVVSVTNNSDGTYTVTFSEPIVNLNPGVDTTDHNFLFFSTSQNNWLPGIFNAPESGSTILVTATGNFSDCTYLIILDTPSDLSAADPFQVVAPIVTVT